MRRWWVEREKMGLIKENVWNGNPKKKIGKKKKTLWHDNNVAPLQRNNNKYYDTAFRYIYRLQGDG